MMPTFKTLSDLSTIALLQPPASPMRKPNEPTTPKPHGHSEWTWVTPSMAAAWLQHNLPNNRQIATKVVNDLATIMTEGKFLPNGESIKISDKQRLLDGQHRCSACVKANVGFWAIVVYDVTEDVYETIDRGHRKTAAHTLQHAGFANATSIAAGVKWIDAIINRNVHISEKSPSEILEFCNKHPEIVSAAHMVTTLPRLTAIIPPSMAVAFAFLLTEADAPMASAFLESLASGSGVSEGDPVYTLRERLLRDRLNKNRVGRGSKHGLTAAFVINAWNAYRSRVKLAFLKGPLAGEDGSVKLPPISGLRG